MISGLGLAMVAQLVPQRLMGSHYGQLVHRPAGAAIIAGKIANLMAVPENVTHPLVSLEVYGLRIPADWYRHRGYRRPDCPADRAETEPII